MAAETYGGATVVIDLGLERGEPDSYTSPQRPTVPRWFAPMLVAVTVLLGTAASAAPPPPALRPVLTLEAAAADPYVLTEGGDLLVQSLGRVAAYDLGDGQRRWQAGAEAPSFRLRTGADLVLLRPYSGGARLDRGTTAVSLTDGHARWRRAGSVVTIAGSPTLLAVSTVRSFSGPGRRVQGAVEAIDPATGRAQWRVPVPSTAVLLGVPGPADAPARMLLLHDDRTAAVHDLTTGAILASAELPPADYGPDNPVISGGQLILRHPVPAGEAVAASPAAPSASSASAALGRPADRRWTASAADPDRGGQGASAPVNEPARRAVSAYDPVTLERRWSRPGDTAYGATACGALTCVAGADGVRAIDPASGAEVWLRPGWRSVEQRGGLTLAYGTASGEGDPAGVIDPANGLVRTDLQGWRLVPGTSGDHLVLTRITGTQGRTMVAVVGPRDVRPRPLAELPVGTGDCQTGSDRLVCRSSSGGLTVWAYERRS
ncbi:hypothetical protein [Actinoplanes sp. NPDC051859]|uniref:hypothetical protein n=1 Tax=Actinoplanes sp. NPDC051859 TaxID=3363909 RepID=UPI00379F6271